MDQYSYNESQSDMMQQLTLSEDTTTSKYEEEFEEIEKIGKGGFGSVYKCKNKLDERLYAIKKVKLRSSTVDDWKKAQAEVKVLANLDHKTIVRYNTSWWEPGPVKGSDSEGSGSRETEDYDVTSEHGESTESGNKGCADSKQPMPCSDNNGNAETTAIRTGILYIQMELCGATLKDSIIKRNMFCKSEEEFITYLGNVDCLVIYRQILQAVEFIHDKDLIHRDLKPQNVFMMENSLIKVGDLGLVTNDIFKDTPALPAKPVLVVDVKKRSKHTSGVGTLTYSAPEQLKGTKYTNKADIYSLGIILFELYQKFNTEMQRCKAIEALKRGIISDYMSECWTVQAELIRKMTTIDPETRPNVKDILADRELFLSKSHIIEDLKEKIEMHGTSKTEMVGELNLYKQTIKKLRDEYAREKEQMRKESDENAKEIEKMRKERDDSAKEIEKLRKERDNYAKVKEQMRRERDDYSNELKKLRQERNELWHTQK